MGSHSRRSDGQQQPDAGQDEQQAQPVRPPQPVPAGQPPRGSSASWPDVSGPAGPRQRPGYSPASDWPAPPPQQPPPQQPSPGKGRSARTQRPKRRYRKAAQIFFGCSVAVLVIVAIAVSLPKTSSKPPARPALTAQQRKTAAAVAAWLHGDGDALYKQFMAAMKAWVDHPTHANAVTWWQMTGISLRHPPPVGTTGWEVAMRDWEKAAQLAGGDPGAPTGGPVRITRWLNAGTTQMRAADTAIAAAG